MDELKYCRVCLVTDVKMFSLETTSSDSIGVVFSHLAQIPLFEGNQFVCFECASILHKFQEFKSKCLRAHNILSSIKIGSTQVTKQIVKNVDRKINKLESTLSSSPVAIASSCSYSCIYYVGPSNYTESGINKTETNEIEYSEISVKTEEDNKADLDKKLDFDETLNEKNEEDYNFSSEEIIPVNIIPTNLPIQNDILSKIKIGSTQVTKQIVKNVYRQINKLEPTLTNSPVTIHCEDPSNNTRTEINKTEDNQIEHSEISFKTEEHKEEVDKKLDFDETLNENNEEDYNVSSEEITPVNIVPTNSPKRKSELNKEPKTKKRKIKTISKSENDCSDDEPLSKNDTKKVATTKPDKKKNGVNMGYFEDFATVVFLTQEDARKEMLLRKESSNYKKSPFKCDLCYRGFEAKAAFENHVKKHSAVYGDYECDFCHLRFPQQYSLYKHRLACHKRKFSCKLCTYVCFGTNQAKRHVSLHKGMKYPCKHCGEVFSISSSLIMHNRMKHLKESVHESVCELCGSTFGTPRGLFLHNMKLHRQDKNDKLGPKCEDCGVHFTSELAWKRHLVLSSKHNVSNGCKFCGETFSNMDDLKTHLRVHSRKQINRNITVKLPAACAICDKWLTSRVEYKSHVTSQHPQSDEAKSFHAEDQTPFVCEVCGQTFKKQFFLTHHQRKHTGERPYKCTACDKTFQQAGGLAIHRRTHERTRAHTCDMCARVLTSKSSLNRHMKVHLDIRPHKCPICDKGFIHMCDLKLHIKCVHDKIPWPKKKNKRNVDE